MNQNEKPPNSFPHTWWGVIWIGLIIFLLGVCLGWYLGQYTEPAEPQTYYQFYEFHKAQWQVAPVYIPNKTLLYSIENPFVYLLAECESGGNPYAYNEKDPNGGSYGLLQYQIPTFQKFCVEKYGLENDIWDYEVQIECCENMLEEGLASHWSCYKKIVN